MAERNIVAVVSVVGFVIVAFTPIVPLLLDSYGINNIYAVKAAIGLISLLCSYGLFWSLFRQSGEKKTKKDGKLHMRPIFLIAGIAVICIAWFTDVPLWISGWTGLNNIYTFQNEVMEGGLGTRLMVSLLTAAGVLLIRFSTFRDDPGYNRPAVDEGSYNNMLDNNQGGIKW